MELKICTSVAECKSYVDEKLNEFEREAEIIAGMLESLDEKAASFEDLKKVLQGEMADAFFKVKKGQVEVFVQPNPILMKKELSKRAEELAKLIEVFRQLSEVLDKMANVWEEGSITMVISADESGGRIFVTLA